VTFPSPGLHQVLAANETTIQALYNADFDAPQSSALPSPIMAMSLPPGPITVGIKAMPPNRKLRPQIICLLLDNKWPGAATGVARVAVQWESERAYFNRQSF
jgi:hypothetical protein